MANERKRIVSTTELVIEPVGDPKAGKWDVVERTVRGEVTAEQKHERGVSLAVARGTWEKLKTRRRYKAEGWR